MKLYGSTTSPYVRKLRILFSESSPKINWEFVVLNIYEKDRATLKKLSPVMKVPLIEEGGKVLYDSRVIFNHCVSKGMHAKLSWDRENLLSIIDGAMDSLINLFLLKRSNVSLDPSTALGTSHRERLELSFAFLEKAAFEGAFEAWDYVSISLFCFLDWVKFREMYPLEDFTGLMEFHASQREREVVKKTDPRMS